MISATVALSVLAQVAPQSRKEAPPPELVDVGVEQKLGAVVPKDLPFTESNGKACRIGDFFDGERPVLLTLNYSNCPQLCSLQLNALLETLQKMSWKPGKQFRVLTVSIDPKETPAVAASTKSVYIEQLNGAEVERGWAFLVGPERSIRVLTDTVGFRYRYFPERNEYAHKAVLIFLDPNGKVVRYLGGLAYDPRDLKFALIEAGEGKVGSFVDQVFFSCFRYDPAKGGYVPVAWKVMRLGGLVVLLAVGGMLFFFWRMERRRAAKRASSALC